MNEISAREQETATRRETEKPIELFPLAEPYPFDLVEEGEEC